MRALLPEVHLGGVQVLDHTPDRRPDDKADGLPLSEPSPAIRIMAAPPAVSAVTANRPSIQAVTTVPSGAGSPSMLTSSLDMWGGTGT